MDDRIDAGESPADRVGVANVADLELHVRGEVAGPAAGAVNLRREIVERAHAVAAREQLVGEVRADEARPAGDEDGASASSGDAVSFWVASTKRCKDAGSVRSRRLRARLRTRQRAA